MPYRRRRRQMVARNPIQSYKQAIQNAPASTVAGVVNHPLVVGVDNYTGPSAANNEVPTGAVVTGFDIQVASQNNLASSAIFLWASIQHTRSGQSPLDPRSLGGNPQRNQTFRQRLLILGVGQNSNLYWKFRIPKKFQRVREGDQWILTLNADGTTIRASQIIYKFYR